MIVYYISSSFVCNIEYNIVHNIFKNYLILLNLHLITLRANNPNKIFIKKGINLLKT